jgi:hypothetical protein
MEKTKPLIFISHKTTDSKIATPIAEFIRKKCMGTVEVFLSSNWKFDGPRFGAGLNSELMRKLWMSDVIILLYTAGDQDWSYCMWECGVASLPQSPDTRVVVFQCGHEWPTPFAHDLRVNVRRLEDLKRFARQLLKTSDFFPSREGALFPDTSEEALEEFAEGLFEVIKDELPKPYDGQVDEWPAWPFLRVELPQSEVDKLKNLEAPNRSERIRLSHEIVKECATIVKSDGRTAQLFGLAGFPDNFKFQDLLGAWRRNNSSVDATWFDSCCEQIRVGARREFPVIWQNSLREARGEAEYTPVLSRVRRVPFGEGERSQFDLYFYNLSDPQAMLATQRMIPASDFLYKNLGESTPESIKLKDLVGELKQRKHHRIPILDGDGHPLYIIHKSMIDQFLADNIVWAEAGKSAADFTLADLLAEPELKKMFETTFVVISAQCTVAEAKSVMKTRPGCMDVFVTENGRRDEPVIGWLTNVDIDRNN